MQRLEAPQPMGLSRLRSQQKALDEAGTGSNIKKHISCGLGQRAPFTQSARVIGWQPGSSIFVAPRPRLIDPTRPVALCMARA